MKKAVQYHCSFPVPLLVLVLHIFIFLHSQPVEAAERIESITVSGLFSMTEEEFRDIFGIMEGDPFDREKIQLGIKRVFQKGIFNDIKVMRVKSSLKIEIEERLFIEDIVISGNERLSKKTLRELFIIKEGMALRTDTLSLAMEDLRSKLKERGFPYASTSYETGRAGKPNRITLSIAVLERTPLIIKDIVFIVPEEEKEARDSEFIEYTDLEEGDEYNKVHIEREMEEVKKRLKDEGYYRPVVGPYTYDRHTGVLRIFLERGKKLNLVFKENTVFSEKKLAAEMPFFETEDAGGETIEEASMRIISLYHEHGYPYAQVANFVVEKDDSLEIEFYVFEEDRYTISDVSFTGNTVDEKRLQEMLQLKEKDIFNPDTIEEEREKLLSFYRALGFIDVSVETFGIDVKKEEKTVSLKITIQEGNQLTISEIRITGNLHFLKDKIISTVHLKTGNIFSQIDISDAKKRILSLYRRHGFADVVVNVSQEILPTGAVLLFQIKEGPRYYFGRTVIRGNRKTDYPFFRRAFQHEHGQPYNYEVLLDERRVYYKTGLFRDIDIVVVDRENFIKDVLYDVREGNPGVIEFGFGYAEDERLRGFFDVRYTHLMGLNRQVRLRTEVSEIEQNFSLSYYEPWLLNHPIPFKANLVYQRRTEKSGRTGEVRYKVEKYSMLSGIEEELNRSIKADLSYQFSLTRTYEVKPDVILSREDVGTLAISSVIPSLILDTRDNPFNPARGFFGGLSLKVASFVLLSETDFVKLSGHINYYRLLTKRFTLALSMRSGIAKGLKDTDDLPIIERFFLGGRTSVRGFPKDELGPKGEKGTPTGGNAFFMGSVELRTDIGRGFGLVTFLDTGNVWEKLDDFNPTDLRYTGGLGVRYMTPVGPLRVDYGYKLDRKEGESAGEFHFSIGHAF